MLQALYTTPLGPGGVNPGKPCDSIGGFASADAWAGGALYDLFGQASTLDAAAGRRDYRCLVLVNTGPPLADVRVFLTQVTPGGFLAVGPDPRPVSPVLSAAPQAVETPSAYAAPPGVAFSAPTAYAGAVALGALPSGFGAAIWLQRTAALTPAAAAEACDVTVQSAAGVLWTRRVYWPVEAAQAPFVPPAPPRPAPYVPTPVPFTRVSADFVTTSGARVTWALDRAFRDPGPYDFQLQLSQSGGATSDDWTDVGPPARDACFLLDPDQRLWGQSLTAVYRVVLTTGCGTYASQGAPVFGVLPPKDWLVVQEILRKERFYQRALVGRAGFLLKAKRYGPYCTCVNPTTHEIGDSACPVCYGQGIVGGYHPPVPSYYATAAPEEALEQSEYNENLGTTKTVTVSARVLADLPLVHKDAWVAATGSDDRYVIWSVKEAAAWMDVPVVYEVELRLAPRSDVLYQYPLVRPPNACPDWQREEHISI